MGSSLRSSAQPTATRPQFMCRGEARLARSHRTNGSGMPDPYKVTAPILNPTYALSFPRRRESNGLQEKLDSLLRGNDSQARCPCPPSALPRFDKAIGGSRQALSGAPAEISGKTLLRIASRPIALSNLGCRALSPATRRAAWTGRPFFGYFLWPRKESNQPPGCPRHCPYQKIGN